MGSIHCFIKNCALSAALLFLLSGCNEVYVSEDTVIPMQASGESALETAGISEEAEKTAPTHELLADAYTAAQLKAAEHTQLGYIMQGLQQNNGGNGQSGLEFLDARVDLLQEVISYKGYELFRYKYSYLPNNSDLVVPIGAWGVTEDGWFFNDAPMYLVYTADPVFRIVGVFQEEFTPTGNTEQFYTDLDRWLNEINDAEVLHTNLEGLSVYPSFGTVMYPCASEMTALEGGLLFVNGLLADVNSVYSVSGNTYSVSGNTYSASGNTYSTDETLYVSLNTVCDILNEDLDYGYYDGRLHVTVNGRAVDSGRLLYRRVTDTVYILPEDLAAILDVSVAYYDGAELSQGADAVRMVEGVPNIMVSRYPENAVKYTAEEAVSRLQRDLIRAYERKFGEFEPLYEKPDRYYSDAYNFRYEVANLSVLAENDRFYIIPFYGYYYADKYTHDIYRYYDGLDQSFYRFDWRDDNALVFAG